MVSSLRKPSPVLLILLAWLFVSAMLLIEDWAATAQTLFDTDDAMRLVEMRAFVHGQGWFDLHQARLQPPVGYDTHWSRLLDAGLAAMFLWFNLFTDAAFAERLMRAVWPLLWLLPTIAGMAAVAWRLAGREGALIALLLAIVGVPAYQQFTPGRIDHHNVQIALTLLAVAATVWSDRIRAAAYAAGGISGLALAVGFECAPYIAGCGAALALRYAFDARGADALRRYCLALGASIAVGFFASVGPDHWTRSLCDEIALNSVAAIWMGAAALVFAGAFRDTDWRARSGKLAVAAILAAGVYLALEPRCRFGPYAMVDPAVWPVWLSDVRENLPLVTVLRVNPLTAIGIATFPAVAFLCTLALATIAPRRRDFAFLGAASVFLLAALTTVAAIRGFSYAMWLGMPLVATFAVRLFAGLHLRSLPARLVAGLMLTPMALSAGTITIADAAGFNDTDSFIRPDSKACFQSAAYAPLAQLPAGLVVTDISFGPFLLALTPHSVMSAPYHRASFGIVAAQRALSSPPDVAQGLLRDLHADYVMICGSRPPAGLAPDDRTKLLWGQLRAGNPPAWLAPVAGGEGQAFSVYRIRS